MRVVLAHSHANTFGGGERAVLEVARELGARHEVRLLLGGFAASRTYAELGSFPGERVGRGRWVAKRVEADAIVTNSFGANLLALRNGDRVVYWAHSLRSVFLQPGRRRPDLLGRRLLDLIAVRRTALLVANSHFAAARLQRLYGRQADAVVYPGVDLNLFQPGAADGGYAITVGRLAPEKGLERLFELWRDLPDVPLHVIGAGSADYESELQRLAPANVRFRGRLATADLADAYRHAAIAVFAPIGEEFGMAAARSHGQRDPGGCLARGRIAGDRRRRADGLSGIRRGDVPPAGAARASTTPNSEDNWAWRRDSVPKASAGSGRRRRWKTCARVWLASLLQHVARNPCGGVPREGRGASRPGGAQP